MDLLLFELQNTPQIRHLSPLHKGGGEGGCLEWCQLHRLIAQECLVGCKNLTMEVNDNLSSLVRRGWCIHQEARALCSSIEASSPGKVSNYRSGAVRGCWHDLGGCCSLGHFSFP